MENPRPAKVAVVEEVRGRLAASTASVVTEYRGLTVGQLAELRKSLAAVGDYKIYKNTLVRLAVAGSEHEGLTELLSGPTAIAFVSGEISAAAKALRDFARTYPALVVKGGLLDGNTLTNQDLTRLADLPSREVLLARFAGGLAAPLQQLAGLLQALPRNLAYGLSALLEQLGGAPAGSDATAAVPDAATDAEASVLEAPAEGAAAESESTSASEDSPVSDPEGPSDAPTPAEDASGEPEVSAEDPPVAETPADGPEASGDDPGAEG